ncbi:glycosyltransferase [Candidatus Roizmanbacteria bacterium]|nr:glycosyltransferase [Candidatus Roizmanbacteria bacterium]
MRVALVYDRVNKWGGAERVLLALHELFPKAPLFTSVHHKKTASWADVFDIKTSFLQKFPWVKTKHEFFPFLMPSAFESFSFDDYDLVISVTSEAAKGIITKPRTKHISYILTPTRYLWSGYDTYFSSKSAKIFSKPVVSALRKWDKVAAQRPDLIVAISEEVKDRIKKYYNREALVIYPPSTLESSKQVKDRIKKSKQGYFLIVSRLSKFAKYKRVDLAIDAFNEFKLPLKIVGSGSWEKELKKKAGATIEFVGGLTDHELVDYYKECDALVFPGVEDFGLTMVEALKFGKPVIAFKGGGALEIVLEGKTGHFFEEQKPESLIKVIKKFKDYKFDRRSFDKQIEKFSFENFKKNFSLVVNKLF